MSYADRKRKNYSAVWLILGWLNIALIPLIAWALLVGMLLNFGFCDTPNSCPHAGTYLLTALIAPIVLWLWLLVSLLRKRHLIAPVIVAAVVDLAAATVAVGLSMGAIDLTMILHFLGGAA